MEIINLLELCSQSEVTVKQALSQFGITKLAEGFQPFADMTEEKCWRVYSIG